MRDDVMTVDEICDARATAPLSMDDVNTLRGHAVICRAQRDHEMAFYFERLADRIAVVLPPE